jgi:hypothetical protein
MSRYDSPVLDSSSKVRVALVVGAAVAVMGGVVASALVSRHAEEETVASGASGGRGLGPTAPDRHLDFPEGCEPQAGAAPAARFLLEGDVLDPGPLKQSETLVRDVTLRNDGRGTLCVRDPETGCGCVKAEWVGERRLAPGESGTVHLTIDTTNREGREEKTVRVATNDPARREAAFKVVVDVRRGLLVAKPATSSFFGRHAPNKPGEIKLRLKSPRGDPPWEVTSVEGQRTKFTWRTEAVEAEDPDFRQVDLVIVHPGAAEATLHNEDVKVRTSHPDRPELLVRTQLVVVTKYYSGPPSVSFGYVGGSTAPLQRTVLVMPGEAHTPFTVTAARVEGQGFVAAAPRQVDSGWAVDLTYDMAPRAEGPVQAKLVVSIDDPEMPTLDVPVRAYVMGK